MEDLGCYKAVGLWVERHGRIGVFEFNSLIWWVHFSTE